MLFSILFTAFHMNDLISAPASKQTSQKIIDTHLRNARHRRYRKQGSMLPKTRALLDDFYGPCNKMLAELLQDTRFLWQDTAK